MCYGKKKSESSEEQFAAFRKRCGSAYTSERREVDACRASKCTTKQSARPSLKRAGGFVLLRAMKEVRR